MARLVGDGNVSATVSRSDRVAAERGRLDVGIAGPLFMAELRRSEVSALRWADLSAAGADRLRTDDFWGFFAARAEMLLRRIETATGKKITREPELFGDDHVVSESYDDGPAQWDPEQVEDIAS